MPENFYGNGPQYLLSGAFAGVSRRLALTASVWGYRPWMTRCWKPVAAFIVVADVYQASGMAAPGWHEKTGVWT